MYNAEAKEAVKYLEDEFADNFFQFGRRGCHARPMFEALPVSCAADIFQDGSDHGLYGSDHDLCGSKHYFSAAWTENDEHRWLTKKHIIKNPINKRSYGYDD